MDLYRTIVLYNKYKNEHAEVAEVVEQARQAEAVAVEQAEAVEQVEQVEQAKAVEQAEVANQLKYIFGFYNWLKINTDYMNEDKYDNLIHIFNMFNVDNLDISRYNIKNIYNNSAYICKGPVRELLKKHNFIFI
jgi:hypothetical protein